jgi:Zn finger protein HypA/HybF involved in hydrogenase expression
MKDSFRVSIPTNDDFFDRECPSCKKLFKMHKDSLQEKSYCPYCGELQAKENLFTQEQIDYAKESAIEDITYEVHKDFANMLHSTFKNSKIVKVKTQPYTKKSIKPLKTVSVDSEIICSQCQGIFQVNGIFGYCPVCRYENLKIYDANIDIIIQEIKNKGESERALRHAYEDLVSAFQGFCKKKFPTATNVNFQNLKNTKKFIKREYQKDIYENIPDTDKLTIRRVFAKRHVHNHPVGDKGLISEEYIKEIPQDKKLFGQKAELSLQEFESAASILRDVLTNISAIQVDDISRDS